MVNVNHIHNFIQTAGKILSNNSFLLIAFIAVFFVKLYIILLLLLHKRNRSQTNVQVSLLILAVAIAIIINFTWILKLTNKILCSAFDGKLLRFWIRITWAFDTIYYHILSLFIESLINKEKLINTRQKILIPITTSIFLFFISLAIVQFHYPDVRPKIELSLIKIVPYYYIIALLLFSLFAVLTKLRTIYLPRILRKQFNIFIKLLFFPIIATEFIHLYPIRSLYTDIRYTITCLSSILVTYTLYRSIRKIMGLRFLNFKGHIHSTKKSGFINEFKLIIEKFSHITNTRELEHITKSFFKESFSIPIHKVHLYIRKTAYPKQVVEIEGEEEEEEEEIGNGSDKSIIETFINAHTGCDVELFLKKEKIIVTDELEFSNFYQEDPVQQKIIRFLYHLNADIIILIYEQKNLIAYIVIDRYARVGHVHKNVELYNNIERDKMIVFASYLGNIIHLMNTKNIITTMNKEKKLKDELYKKTEEIALYRKSITSFLRTSKEKRIGIIFYKNRHFTHINQIAQTLIPINLNTHTGHPMTKSIKQIAQQVIEYKSPQTIFLKNSTGETLIITGIINIEHNNVIITVRYPEISDFLKNKISLLKDPTKWEYLLYLKTTDEGKFINQHIPGKKETLINFKIDLLQATINNKAILLCIPDEDILPTVEILHHISKREILHIIDLQNPISDNMIDAKLFGTAHTEKNGNIKPLMQKLNNIGTLFIKNIQFLNIETQHNIAKLIQTGSYKNSRHDHIAYSDVRIICSTDINLEAAAKQGTFSQTLYEELLPHLITMPPLDQIPDKEFISLIDQIAKQSIKTYELKRVLELTESEKKKIIKHKPESLSALKRKIQAMLIKKSKQQSIYDETEFDLSYHITDPELLEAAQLGKHALRDAKIMTMLWNKFKNQNKIATLLGVNRSSVNRRCKDYNLVSLLLFLFPLSPLF